MKFIYLGDNQEIRQHTRRGKIIHRIENQSVAEATTQTKKASAPK